MLDASTRSTGPSRWHLDAWAVTDGVAFASHRPPDSIDATNTVFIAVPALEPVPIGRITTALSASRYSFQDGLRDANGEVGFDDLDQVVELVRRGFLAGGLGPDAGPALGVEFEPAPTSGAGSAWLRESFVDDVDLVGKDGYPDLRSLLRDEHAARLVARVVETYARAVAIEWEGAIAAFGAALPARRALRRWYIAVGASGLDIEPGGDIGGQLFHAADRYWYREFGTWALGSRLDATSPRKLLAAAPMPRRPDWPVGTCALDGAVLPLVDPHWFERYPRLQDSAPLLLAAWLESGWFRGAWIDRLDHDWEQSQVEAVVRWIEAELPKRILPTAAEELLRSYAYRRLPATDGT